MKKQWVDEEIAYLKENYHSIRTRDIAVSLNCPVTTVTSKAWRLRLTRPYHKRNLPDEQGEKIESQEITKETYSQAIARARKDKRLCASDCVFLYHFIFILDDRGETYTDLSMSALVEETGLSMGAVNDAMKHLISYGYLEGDLHFNPRTSRKNYRLWLFGTPGPINKETRVSVKRQVSIPPMASKNAARQRT